MMKFWRVVEESKVTAVVSRRKVDSKNARAVQGAGKSMRWKQIVCEGQVEWWGYEARRVPRSGRQIHRQ